jgi:hypothetical protein
MIQPSPTSPFTAARRVFGVRRHRWRATVRFASDVPVLENEAAVPSTLVEDLIYFAGCYVAGLVFFLIMLT